MKRRSTEILQKLLQKRTKQISISYLSKEYTVSPKTIRNDIKEINKFLDSIPISHIEIDESGILYFDENIDLSIIEDYLYNMDLYVYKLSSRERQIYILVSLFMTKKYISMQQIAEELYVSRVTIISDIDDVKKYLNKFNVNFMLDIGKGMMLQCSYEEKVNILISIYKEIVIENKGFFQKLIIEKMNIKYQFYDISTHIQEYSKINNIIFAENIFYEIVLFLFIIFNIPQEQYNNYNYSIDCDITNDIEGIILYEGEMLKVEITNNMLEFFTFYIKQNKLDTFIKPIDEIELYKVIINFISEIEKDFCIDLVNDNILLDSLFMHIKGIKDWGDYEIEIPKKETYSLDYEHLEKLVEKYIFIVEDFLKYNLNINMKRSIVIHICVALIRNRKYVKRLSVVIVCPGSMATGKYLEAQIQNYFNFNIVGVYAIDTILDVLDKQNEHIDFVISTVKISLDNYKVIIVNSFLSMEDLNLIQKEIFNKQQFENIHIKEKEKKILDYISEIITESDLKAELINQVENIFSTYKQKHTKEMENPLYELLQKDFILKEDSILDWKTAIKISASPLKSNGYITQSYIEKSIQNVEKYGSYIILSPNVALAHADKNSGVIKDGLSLLVSKKPILFPKKQKVNLLFCFSSKGEKEYLNLLKSIISIGKNKEKLSHIISLNDKEEIYQSLLE